MEVEIANERTDVIPTSSISKPFATHHPAAKSESQTRIRHDCLIYGLKSPDSVRHGPR